MTTIHNGRKITLNSLPLRMVHCNIEMLLFSSVVFTFYVFIFYVFTYFMSIYKKGSLLTMVLGLPNETQKKENLRLMTMSLSFPCALDDGTLVNRGS